jgi:hypothetical protein
MWADAEDDGTRRAGTAPFIIIIICRQISAFGAAGFGKLTR